LANNQLNQLANSNNKEYTVKYTNIKGDNMSKIVKVIEVLAESEKSWEDAADNAIKEAGKTVKNIKSIYISNMNAKVDKNKMVKYRINAKISFVVN